MKLRSDFQIHGHRGCRGLFPENTIPAFEKASKLGVDALELDIVISKDTTSRFSKTTNYRQS